MAIQKLLYSSLKKFGYASVKRNSQKIVTNEFVYLSNREIYNHIQKMKQAEYQTKKANGYVSFLK